MDVEELRDTVSPVLSLRWPDADTWTVRDGMKSKLHATSRSDSSS
jgi:hypothetical protein